MNSNKGKRYSEEFKLNAIRIMSEKKKSVLKIAHELDINVMTLYRWRKEYHSGIKELKNNNSLESEVIRLRHELELINQNCKTLANTIKILSNNKLS